MRQQAIIAARTANGAHETAEIEALADASGYDVVETVTQTRREDPSYYLGQGKAETITQIVAEENVGTVIVDGALTPTQTRNLQELFDGSVDVLDRERLILDVFADQASTKTAALQVEYAKLRYRLPRIQAELQEGTGNDAQRPEPSQRIDGEHRRIRELRNRMDRIEAELATRSETEARRRAQRHEQGFDLLAIVGYTNAGKSMLLHRLADDLAVADQDPGHEDLDPVAAVEDRLFRTLETTTRRVTIRGRPTLATDTVGFVDDLSHEVVRSFGTTLGAAREADVVVLVADALDDPEEFAEKLRVSIDAIDGRDGQTDPDKRTDPAEANSEEDSPLRGSILPVLNKIDRLDEESLQKRFDALGRLRTRLGEQGRPIADRLAAPVAISALRGDGIERLQDRIETDLPASTAEFNLPNCGETQALLAWAHEHGTVEDVSYTGDRVQVSFTGRPDIVEQAREKAATIEEGSTVP